MTFSAFPIATQRKLIEESVELRLWSFAERLCSESELAAPDNAARALELAQFAVRIVELAPASDAWRSMLQGYARAFVANAERVSGDLPAASKSFANAWSLWREGQPFVSRSPLREWRLFDLEASLYRALRQFDAALESLDRAVGLAPADAQGRIWLKRAYCHQQAGDAEGALAAFQQAAPLVNAGGSDRDKVILYFNQTSALCQLGRYKEAHALLAVLSEQVAALENHLDLLRFVWLRGRVAAGMQHRDEAQTAFEQVKREFAELGNGYEVALVSLDLAIILLEERRAAEVAVLAGDMLDTFRAQGVHRESFAAIRLFHEAARTGSATVSLAKQVLDYLEQARRDPNLRFGSLPSREETHEDRR
jgi:tetratricopeptide (TPR) repeat protein